MGETPQATEASTGTITMRAIVRDAYGGADVLSIETIEAPPIEPHQVMVQVHATSVNPAEWHRMTGTPYLARLEGGFFRPKSRRLGADFSGVVVQVGSDVTRFAEGDEVFGEAGGSFAEYIRAAESVTAHKPSNVSHQDAGSIGIAGLTALQALRDKGKLAAGQHVLINGASGGVGTFAVQIAKAMGAEVTGVCSARNVDLVRSIGADHVVDYTTEDIRTKGTTYDVILDAAGGWSLGDVRSLLRDEGIYVAVGSEKKTSLGLLAKMAAMFVRSRFGSRSYGTMLARARAEDLEVLGGMLGSGAIDPVIEETFSLDQVPEAMRRQGEGHARGKKVIVVVPGGQDR